MRSTARLRAPRQAQGGDAGGAQAGVVLEYPVDRESARRQTAVLCRRPRRFLFLGEDGQPLFAAWRTIGNWTVPEVMPSAVMTTPRLTGFRD